MVAVNSLTMLFLYGLLGGWLLGVNKMPVPWEALLLSVGIYVALPLVAGYFSRVWIMKAKGPEWFAGRFLHFLTPVSIIALLATLVLLFSFKGETILGQSAHHSLDRDSAGASDAAHFRHHLRCGQIAASFPTKTPRPPR